MKKLKLNLSIKAKIILGVVGVFIFATSLNLLYSYHTFNSDKSSYLYESVLRKSESTLNSIDFYAENLKGHARSNLIQSSIEGVNFQEIINQDKNIIQVAKIYPEDAKSNAFYVNQSNITKLQSKTGFNQDKLNNTINAYMASLAKTKEYNNVYFYSNSSEIIFVVSLIKTEKNPFTFVTILDASEVNRYLQSDNIYINKIFFLNDKISKNVSSDWINQISYKNFNRGSAEVTLDGKSKLLAFSTSRLKNFIVASYVDKNNALSISKFLILKSVLFSLSLMGISIAIAIYFASGISHPLKLLTASADAVSKGNYNQKLTVNTTDELGVLATSFNVMSKEIRKLLIEQEDMIKKLEKANAQLQNYSHKLESMVEARTNELKSVNVFMEAMVNSLTQGLFVFDKNLICNKISTRACQDIFDTEPSGKNLLDVLQISEENEQRIVTQWAQIVFSGMIPFDSAVELGPKSRDFGGTIKDESYKHVKIQYYPMRDENDDLINLVAVATDDTKEILALEKAKEQEAYVSMILKIVKNKVQFQSFCHEVREIFEKLTEICNDETSLNLELAMMLFHTLNGGFGLYFIQKLQLQARAVEGEILKVKSDEEKRKDYAPTLKAHSDSIQNEFSEFLKNLDSIIGSRFADGEKTLEIQKTVLEDFRDQIKVLEKKEIKLIFEELFIKEPVGLYFMSYKELCRNLAVGLGKKIAPLHFHGEDLRVDVAHFADFFNTLVHLFRNCVDHGIEAPSDRVKNGKPEIGNITVTFKSNNKCMEILIEDDGGGINPEIIKRKYSQLRPDFNFEGMTNDEIIYLIFDPFFSTKEEVSMVSGRGVGMSAIKDSIEKINGEIVLMSEVGVGSKFRFIVPYPAA